MAELAGDGVETIESLIEFGEGTKLVAVSVPFTCTSELIVDIIPYLCFGLPKTCGTHCLDSVHRHFFLPKEKIFDLGLIACTIRYDLTYVCVQ